MELWMTAGMLEYWGESRNAGILEHWNIGFKPQTKFLFFLSFQIFSFCHYPFFHHSTIPLFQNFSHSSVSSAIAESFFLWVKIGTTSSRAATIKNPRVMGRVKKMEKSVTAGKRIPVHLPIPKPGPGAPHRSETSSSDILVSRRSA